MQCTVFVTGIKKNALKFHQRGLTFTLLQLYILYRPVRYIQKLSLGL